MTAVEIQDAKQLTAQREAEYLRLARRKSMGEAITAEEIADCCRDAGKSPDDFDRLCGSLSHRAKLRADVAEKDRIDREAKALEDIIAKEKKALDDAALRYQREVIPSQERLQQLYRKSAELYCVPSQLARSCPDESLQLAFQAAEQEVRRLRQPLQDAQSNLHKQSALLESVRQSPNEYEDDFLPEARQRVERAEKAVQEIQKAMNEAARRHNEIHEQMVNF